MNVLIDEGGYMPTKAHEEDAGFDLYAPDNFVVSVAQPAIIDTKVHIAIPKGYVGMIKSKSGLNVKQNITCVGVCDAGYEGSIVVKLYKHCGEPYQIKKGDKITQIVIMPISEVNELTEVSANEFYKGTDRGSNGFGSTDTRKQ